LADGAASADAAESEGAVALASDAVFVDGEAIADWMGSEVEDRKVAETAKRAKGATRSREKGRRGGKRGEVNVSRQGGAVKRSKSKVEERKRRRGGKTGRRDRAKRGEEKEKGWIIMH
jgi:hypothetical protein